MRAPLTKHCFEHLYRAVSCDVIFCAHPFHGGHVGVLQCTVLNGFHRRYGEMQVANRPLLTYYNADNSLSNLC